MGLRGYRFVPSLPTLDPHVFLPTTVPQRPLVYPFDRAGTLYYLARAGVHRAIRHLLGGREGVVLMPSYHHGVEVEAVRAAGAQVTFYRVDASMHIDLDDIRRLLNRRSVRVLYVTHFVGFAQPVVEAARLCAERGVSLVEDCALSLLSRDDSGRPLGSTGDAAIFCLYKSLPVPHGGLLVMRSQPVARNEISPPVTSTLHHIFGSVLAHLELRSGPVGRALRHVTRLVSRRTIDQMIDQVRTGTTHLAERDLRIAGSALVNRLLRRFDLEMVVVRRRRNFRRLAEALADQVPVLGAPLGAGVCPLFVPVRVSDKANVVRALHARGIDAIDFWNHSLDDGQRFPDATLLRRELLELPCHQSLDDEDIDFVARAVKEELVHVGARNGSHGRSVV